MIAERYTDYMYNLIDRVLKEIGPREACTEQEKECGRLFASEIAPACERVETESFTCSPNAFMGLFPFLVSCYVAAVVLYFFLPAAAAALALVGGFVLFFEVVRYKELMDPLFKKREGENVSGYVRPRGEPKRRVYVSAHLDSAFEFKIWYWFKGFSVVLMAVGFLAVLLAFGFSLARAIAEPVGTPEATVFWVLGFVLVALTPVQGIFAFWHTSDVVPGAMDDMAGVAVLAGLARYLADARDSGEFYPESTEVVLVGMSSEEAGLRGAKRYAPAHRGDGGLPAYGILLDNIYDDEHLTVNTKEVWPGGRMDPGLVQLTVDAAEALGYKARRAVVPVGATDATAFAQAGIPSVSICMQDTTRLVPVYHTRYDTIDIVKPSSLEGMLGIVIEMLRRLDARAQEA